MKSSSRMVLGVIAAATLAASAMAAHAQPWRAGGCVYQAAGAGQGYSAFGGGPRQAGMMGAGPRGFGPGAAGGQRAFGPRGGGPGFSQDARLAALKTQLKITPDQESAWNGYATQAKQNAAGMQALRAKAQGASQSGPDRATQRAEFARQRAANMDAMSGAIRNLYAALTPEQQTLADGYLAGRGAGRFGGRGNWR